MSYLEFLTKLLASNKIPRVIAFITAIVALIEEYSDIWTAPAAIEHNASAEVDAAESSLVTACHDKIEHGAIGDGGLIRALRAAWAFAQEHPEIMALLLKLIA